MRVNELMSEILEVSSTLCSSSTFLFPKQRLTNEWNLMSSKSDLLNLKGHDSEHKVFPNWQEWGIPSLTDLPG